jgi:hypothetical protein
MSVTKPTDLSMDTTGLTTSTTSTTAFSDDFKLTKGLGFTSAATDSIFTDEVRLHLLLISQSVTEESELLKKIKKSIDAFLVSQQTHS